MYKPQEIDSLQVPGAQQPRVCGCATCAATAAASKQRTDRHTGQDIQCVIQNKQSEMYTRVELAVALQVLPF
jgi:hypothetical protein